MAAKYTNSSSSKAAEDELESLTETLATLRMCGRGRQSGQNQLPKRVTRQNRENEAKIENKLYHLTNRIPLARLNAFLRRRNDDGDTILMEIIIYGWVNTLNA